MKKISFALILVMLTSLLIAQENDVAITVYNNRMALVKDVREMDLDKGKIEVNFRDVASTIDPTSVHFKSLTSPEDVSILEQNYEFDLVSQDKVLEKYIDQNITVFTKQDGPFTGKLLSHRGGSILLQMDAGNLKSVLSSAVINIDFPSLPEGLITRPTLVWHLNNDGRDGTHKAEVSYLAQNIDWHAEYVAVSKKEDTELELNSWVSIENQSGTDYENAKLKVVAGDVNLAQRPQRDRVRKGAVMMAESAQAPQFEEKAFFEYHLYTLQRRTTIKNNQIKQISLFPTATTKIDKIYLYNGARYGEDVRVNLEFKNSKETGLGIPLPMGKVRVYKEDEADEALEFVGEDFIDHTPKDEKVRLYVGNAFDIKGERTK
ncbi:DUF4139 domain-containing protein, partial [candidate division KSB1 bacterium]|nr:DUF4139 domain-containing protein [candidate division KSB1 bacterium]